MERPGMKRLIWSVVAVFFVAVGLANAADWLTDGGDIQRSGWQKDEKILTPANVKDMKILWTYDSGNQVRALHSLMPALVVDNVSTANGPKQIVIFTGISDNIYALDASNGAVIWKQHFTYPPPPAPAFGPPPTSSNAPEHLNFLGPGGSSDVPVIGPADAQGRRPVYFVDGGGMLHTLNLADGTDITAPYLFARGKGWSLNLVGNVLWMPTGEQIHAVRLDDPEHNVASWSSGSGGMWGRRGAAVDSTGIAWTTTGDGTYDPASKRYANSLAGFQLSGVNLVLKDYFTPTNWGG